MATALQLINRIRRLHRFHDVSEFAANDRFTTVLLDLLNSAQREVLETETWDFDERHDGTLRPVPRWTITNGIGVTNQSSVITLLGSSNVSRYTVANALARLVVTDDSRYPNTAFRIRSWQASGVDTIGLLAEPWPGVTDGFATGFVVAYEYGLPDSRRSIYAARHEETPLFIEQVSSGDSFASQIPRFHENEDTPAEVLRVGGVIEPTLDSGSGGSAAFMTRVALWPVPTAESPTEESNYQIEYDYTRARQDLTGVASTLDGVPVSVEDLIVDLAYARSHLAGVGSDPQLGSLLEKQVLARTERIRSGRRPGRGERHPIRSIEHASGSRRRPTSGWGRLPRTFGSL